MSDFLLDFRPSEVRRTGFAAATEFLGFCDDSRATTVEGLPFGLSLVRVDDPVLWGPYRGVHGDGEVLVALAGRVAMDATEWESARQVPGNGGVACKAIFERYRRTGIEALGELNGNFGVVVFDEAAGEVHVVTDYTGMYVTYGTDGVAGGPVLGSHPDAVALAAGEERDWDLVSMAEFIRTGRLTYPYTYYRRIRALDTGTIHTFETGVAGARQVGRRRYFDFNFRLEAKRSEHELAESLAGAFRGAVRRRTLPLFGRTAIGMSGGLDSRAIASVALPAENLCGFTLYDEDNLEVQVAKSISHALAIDWIPLRREFEYYGDTAEQGTRIAGGMGCFASNHFLGARTRLRDAGVGNLLTGCYCDYLFKGLALNRTERKFSRVEEIGSFAFDFYRPVYRLESEYQAAVDGRLAELFPEAGRGRLSDEEWLEVERKRSFPLAYEGDLAQRVIPQRVLPWYVPIVDRDLMAVYLTIPPRVKLNASLFTAMLGIVADPRILHIADSNTGGAPGGSVMVQAFHRYLSALQNRLAARKSSMATRGSWPNWGYYLKHSRTLPGLWERPSEAVRVTLNRLLGEDPWRRPVHEHAGRDIEHFLRLMTLGLWIGQRG